MVLTATDLCVSLLKWSTFVADSCRSRLALLRRCFSTSTAALRLSVRSLTCPWFRSARHSQYGQYSLVVRRNELSLGSNISALRLQLLYVWDCCQRQSRAYFTCEALTRWMLGAEGKYLWVCGSMLWVCSPGGWLRKKSELAWFLGLADFKLFSRRSPSWKLTLTLQGSLTREIFISYNDYFSLISWEQAQLLS